MDVRSYRGANVDTDHILVRSKVRFRLCKNFFRKRESGNYKPDTSKLMEKNILKEHKLKLSAGIISELDSSGNDFNWKSVREIILKSANETVLGLERRARNEWYDEDCRKATEMKNKAYLQLLQKHCTRTHEEKYRELRKAEKKLLRRKKEIFFENSLKNLENYNSQNECRKFYKSINRMRSEFKSRTITCRNKRGEFVSEPHEVTKVWKDYFQDLLEGRDEPIVLQNVHTEQDIIADEENPPPSITEVTLDIKK
ncbi:endonuclease-reverse transcriptase [Trichonephila clavipes]|nr:endonuclease-reverse transcriptase [Trichonephila clavipes]